MARGFVLGVLVTLVVLAAGGFLAMNLGVVAPGADVPPGKLETWVALKAIHHRIHQEAEGLTNPLPLTDENLRQGLEVYEQHCLICHGAADGQSSDIALGLNIPAPQFADEGVGGDPVGRIYWVARHGVRFSGMPAFAKTLSDTQLWQVSLFLSRMEHLPADIEAGWKKLPSMAPAKVAPAQK